MERFLPPKMKGIIGKDGCSPGVDKILLGTLKIPLNLLTSFQTQYFKELQWKNKIRPTDAPEIIKLDDIKEGFKKWKEKPVPHHPTDISVTINPC